MSSVHGLHNNHMFYCLLNNKQVYYTIVIKVLSKRPQLRLKQF